MSKMINCENCGGQIDPNYNFCQYCGCMINRYVAEDGMEFYNLKDFCEYEWSYNKGFAKENIFLYDENLNKIVCYNLKDFEGSLNFAKFIYIVKPLSERFSFALKKVNSKFESSTPFSISFDKGLILAKGFYRQRYIKTNNGKSPIGYEYLEDFPFEMIKGETNE